MPTHNMRILLDTNILIQTEDNKQVEVKFAELLKKCQQHSVSLYLHDGTIEDIKRDKDQKRRDITLSKVAKYPLLEKIPYPDKADLEKTYGAIKNDNDFVDVKLLHTVKIKVVGFLITEDIGLHTRAKHSGLGDQVLLVSEALDWIRQTYEPKSVSLPHVAALKCHQVDLTQEIFTTLKNDYTGFEKWFEKCIEQHRDCWIVTDDNTIIAIAIWKEETGEEYQSDFTEGGCSAAPKDKILKICTFKVGTDARGSKIGEHLLKQSLWHAHENNFNWVYLTAFPEKQPYLLSFLEEFGFSIKGKNNNDEVIIAKPIVNEVTDLDGLAPLECHKKFYPSYYDGENIQKFFVPILPKFHLKLFPEYTTFEQPMLFTPQEISKIKEEISGNTIRKVYLSRAQCRKLKLGDLVFFYMSKNDTYQYSQCLTIVGVVDGVTECKNLSELLQVTAKRSVYSHDDLSAMFHGKRTPVKAMDFLIAGHIKTKTGLPPNLEALKKIGLVKNQPSQSISKIDEAVYKKLKNLIEITHGIGN